MIIISLSTFRAAGDKSEGLCPLQHILKRSVYLYLIICNIGKLGGNADFIRPIIAFLGCNRGEFFYTFKYAINN